MECPERLVVGHPFNPVYLLPMVEVVGGELTSSDAISRAMAVYDAAGMRPLHVRVEIDAFIADRLLEAVWREALWLINDGVATTQEIDDVIRFGFGLRWAQMGLFENYRIAGGESGMAHFISQFGPTLSWPWSKLTDTPELTEALTLLISEQSDSQSGHHTIAELERIRDENLVDIMLALEKNQWGAGQSVSDILNVNAAPGFSEHHTGRAIDLAEPGAEPLTEDFESSAAFVWLEKNAANFGFSMSYPRENRQGFIYEPWHWAKTSR